MTLLQFSYCQSKKTRKNLILPLILLFFYVDLSLYSFCSYILFTYQFKVLGMCENCLSKVDRSIDYRLFLFTFQYTRYNRLRCDAIASMRQRSREQAINLKNQQKNNVKWNPRNAPVIDDNGAESIKTRQVHGRIYPDTLQIIAGCNKSCSVTAQLFVMIAHVEAERKEDVIPDKHLHFGFLTGIDRHYITIDHRHCSTSRGGHKVTVNLTIYRLREIIKRKKNLFIKIIILFIVEIITEKN